MSEPKPAVEVTDPVALRALAHPLRLSLVGLLRREGPQTATQAASQLGESVPNCSFHLRQLAKYGLVERIEGADAREKPWQATAMTTRWGNSGTDDPQVHAAEDQLNAVIIRRYYERAMQWLQRRDSEPLEWRAVTGVADVFLHLTAEELAELQRRQEELVAPYRERQTNPSLRPPGSRVVSIYQYTTLYE